MRFAFAFALIAFAVPASAGDRYSANPADARRALQGFGECLADRAPEEAERVLKMDFTTDSYRIGLRRLAKDLERPCASKSFGKSFGDSVMKTAPLLLAGAMAERLMAKDSAPLNVRLAKATAHPAPPARSITDAIAMCVARSAPDQTARLFATEIASDAEAQAIKALDLAVKLCSRGKLEVNTEGLRAMLATAAFRNVHPTALAERG